MPEADRGELQCIGRAGKTATEIHFLQCRGGGEFDVQLPGEFTGPGRIECELAIELGHGAERNGAGIAGVDERASDFQFSEVEIRLAQLSADCAFNVEGAERGEVDRQLQAREFRQGVDPRRVEREIAGDQRFGGEVDPAGEAGPGEFGGLGEFPDVDRQRVEGAGNIAFGVDLAELGKVERDFDVCVVEQRADGFRACRERAVQCGHVAKRDGAVVAGLDEVGADRCCERRGLACHCGLEGVEIGLDVEAVALEEAFRVKLERFVQFRHCGRQIQFAQLVARARPVVLVGEAGILEAQVLHGAVKSTTLRGRPFGRRRVIEHPVGGAIRLSLQRH